MSDPSAGELLAARPHLEAHAFDGLLLEGVPLAAVAAEFGTPTYVYGAGTIKARCRRLRAAMPGVAAHYAVKALDHLAVLSVIAGEGLGADVVSGGELLRSLQAGFAPGMIVFSGVGKTAEELRLALGHGVGQINVESAEELAMLSAIAASMGGDGAGGAAGEPGRGRGYAREDQHRAGGRQVSAYPWGILRRCTPKGRGCRGSGCAGWRCISAARFSPWRRSGRAYAKLARLVRELRTAGLSVEAVDCGGGLGVGYQGEPEVLPEAWAGAIGEAVRWARGGAGGGAGAVGGGECRGAVGAGDPHQAGGHGAADRGAGCGDERSGAAGDVRCLAWHRAGGGSRVRTGAGARGDRRAGVREQRYFRAGQAAGAFGGRGFGGDPGCRGLYGTVMSSTYNARPRAAQVLVEGGVAHLITARGRLEALFEGEIVPSMTQACSQRIVAA